MRSMALIALAVVLAAGVGHAEEQPHAAQPIDIVRVIGHTESITSLAFSPDGKTLATGSKDYTVKLWNVATGLMLRTIEGQPYGIQAVAFSGNGKDVLSVSELLKITLNISDATTGQLKRSLAIDAPGGLLYNSGHSGAIAFSPDGGTVALAVSATSTKSEIEIVDTNTGTVIRRIDAGHETLLAFSPDGRQLAATNEDQTVTLRDPATGKEVRRLGGGSWFDIFKTRPKDSIRAIAFSSDGRKLAVATSKTLIQFDVADGKELSTFEPGVSIDALAFSPDGRMLATASSGDIDIRDAASGASLRKLEGHKGSSQLAIAFSPDGRSFASAGGDKLIKLWDATSWSQIHAIAGLDYTIGAVAFAADGATLASDSYGGFTVLWDAAQGRFLRALEKNQEVSSGTYNYTYTIGFSPNGRLLASGSRPATILVWNTATGEAARSIRHSGNDGVGARSVALLPPGELLLIGGATYGRTEKVQLPAVIADLATNKIVRTLEGKTHASGVEQFVYPIAVSPDGKLVAAASRDRVVNIFDAASGRPISSIQTGGTAPNAIAFSPDGKILASANSQVPTSTIEQWDVETGKLLRKIDAHAHAIRCLAFSPDNRVLVSGGEDKIIKLWNPADGAQLGSLREHSGWVTSLAFAANGDTMVSASSDGTLKVWRTDHFNLLATLVAEPGGDWIAFTPEGFFDSAGRKTKLAAVSGLDAYPIDSLYDELHRPDLVREKLKGDPLGNVKAAATTLNLTKRIGQH